MTVEQAVRPFQKMLAFVGRCKVVRKCANLQLAFVGHCKIVRKCANLQSLEASFQEMAYAYKPRRHQAHLFLTTPVNLSWDLQPLQLKAVVRQVEWLDLPNVGDRYREILSLEICTLGLPLRQLVDVDKGRFAFWRRFAVGDVSLYREVCGSFFELHLCVSQNYVFCEALIQEERARTFVHPTATVCSIASCVTQCGLTTKNITYALFVSFTGVTHLT